MFILGADPYGHNEDIHEQYQLTTSIKEVVAKTNDTKKVKKSTTTMIKKKDLVTADLDKRFDELLELNLIEMPEEYYEEKVYFESTEALNELFTKLEEENLAKINKI